ncbi:hypothetical protein HZ994_11855 [Akkermansiaceae bacterium]|nr:hypothetical protein HZ994_11855 [Akkermansiaceae bacterium]
MTPASIRKGFALPMTIIAVAGLTLLLIGLLTVLTLERKTARSYSDSARAELALESGLAIALGKLGEIARRDDSLVFRLDDPATPTVPSTERPLGYREQFFTYGATFGKDLGNPSRFSWTAVPLFSGSDPSTISPPVPGDTASPPSTPSLLAGLADYSGEAIQIGRLNQHDQSIPRAKWVDVPSTDPKGYTMRYSYWIEDLSGRIDGTKAGAEPRTLGKTTAELPLFSFFGETPGPQQDTLVSRRSDLRTPASVRQLLGMEPSKLIEPYIDYSHSPAAVPAAKLVPAGFGYKDAGQPARDINEFVSDSNIAGLADYIAENLPDFDDRKGAFRQDHDYVKTLAASIIDYADTDSNPTAGTGYRGIDSFPFVNKIYDRYEWLNPSPTATNVQIRMDTYVEFWNPSNKPANGQARFQIINPVKAKISTLGDLPFSPANPIYTIGALSIAPNQHRVVNIGGRVYTFPKGAFSTATVELTSSTETNGISDANYSLLWRDSSAVPFQEIDTAFGGSQRQFNTLTTSSTKKWKGAGSPNLNTDASQYGDPRASMYIAEFHYSNTYTTNAAWGGRVLKTTGPSGARDGFVSRWNDRGSNTSPGVAAGNESFTPGPTGILNASGTLTRPYPAAQPDRAPAVISNSGRYESIGELGNIFDPAQWANAALPSSTPDRISGGGITLAIGRPEYHAFDQEGRRAAQLLDLFSAQPTLPGTPARPININTASPEVLRSLMAGITLGDDPLLNGTLPPKAAKTGDLFARYVSAHRNISPLRGPSDLNLLRPLKELAPAAQVQRNHSSPSDDTYFGSHNIYPAASRPADAAPDPGKGGSTTESPVWSDAGREELLRKTLDLVSFTSKSFRIVAAGEVRSASGELLGRKNREYHYTIEPERDANGLVVAGGKLTITKHYERDL